MYESAEQVARGKFIEGPPCMRFTLKKLLALVTAVALLLGARQVRRMHVERQIEDFRSDGVRMESEDRWTDYLWPRLPAQAEIEVTLLPDNQFEMGSKQFDLNGAAAHYEMLCQRFKEYGIANPTILAQGKERAHVNIWGTNAVSFRGMIAALKLFNRVQIEEE
jgi:hypothetical protein